MSKSTLSFNPVLERLPVYQPGRPIEEVARELGLTAGSIIKLASNENPLGPSPAALAAMQEVLARLHLYPDGNAFHLKQRLAAKLEMDPAHLILGNGSNEILEFVGHLMLGPDAEVVISQYAFAVYPIVTHMFGATPVVVPAKKYGHDLPAMLSAVTSKTRVIFAANPNNPTGTLASAADVLGLIEQAPRNVLVVLDEAYIEFLEQPQDLLPLIRAGLAPNLLLCRTFSKIFGLAGMRLGYGLGQPGLIAAMEKARQPFNINAVAQAGALAALDDAGHMARTRANNQQGLAQLQDAFQQWSLEFVPSKANFVLVRVGDGQRVWQQLQQRGVIVRPMAIYQLPEWVRITVGTPAENQRCLAALQQTLALPALT